MAEHQDRQRHRMSRLLALLLLAAAPAAADIRSAEDCAAAVAVDPAAAREAAAVWQRLGGGVPARLCEAEALAALGAHATSAQLLTGLATNPNRAMPAALRATVLADAGRQWLAAGRADLARAAVAEADRIAPPGRDRRLLAARAAAAEADWPAAEAALRALLDAAPDDALGHALLAAALRNAGDPQAALAEAEAARRLDPGLPEALFETGAALAETGRPDRAAEVWLELISADPDSELAALARANIQRLN
jgi:tetratricopeptide (TPR) repeat protein